MKEKIKSFISSLELRLSDLFLLIGFLAFAIFLIFGQEFMQHPNPNEVALPLWAAIICFVIMIGCWGYYLYLEIFVRKTPINLIIPCCFACLILLNIITIAVQPGQETYTLFQRINNDLEGFAIGSEVVTTITITGIHKFIFISEMIGVGSFIYIGLFLFPRRFKNYKFLLFLGYALYFLIFVLIIYSIATEGQAYKNFFTYFLGDKTGLDFNRGCTVKSFIIHRNAFGMVYMLGIIFAFINQGISKKWFNYPLAGLFFVGMVFTFCKTALLLSALIILGYFVYQMVITFKDNKKRNIIALSIVLGIGVLAVGILAIAVLSKGRVLGSLYQVFMDITLGGSTLDSRSYIWDNCFKLLHDGWWLIGRGFGSINEYLRQLNLITHNDKAFPTHSSFLNMLAEGGIIFLLAYLAFLGYVTYVIIKCFKKDSSMTFRISLGVVAFFLYTFIETIHYLMLIFLFPIFIIYFMSQKEEKQIKTEETERKPA